jgi:hypothetical protein
LANNYLQFSAVIPRITLAEEQWLDEQLAVVYVFDGEESGDGHLPAGKALNEAKFAGCRAFRDVEGGEWGDEEAGFEHSFGTDEDGRENWGRHLWIYAEEGGDVERVAHLVKKFLKKFRPGECWSLSYATTCSKPRVGEFGGGAVFVTADDVKWQSTYIFLCGEQKAFDERRSASAS